MHLQTNRWITLAFYVYWNQSIIVHLRVCFHWQKHLTYASNTKHQTDRQLEFVLYKKSLGFLFSMLCDDLLAQQLLFFFEILYQAYICNKMILREHDMIFQWQKVENSLINAFLYSLL